MADTRIHQLREILANAAARDRELQQTLEILATDLLKDLGADDARATWAELKAAKGERQVDEHFIIHEGWLRGDLVIEVAPDTKLVVNLRIHRPKERTHEVGLTSEPSRSVVIDPPDPKHAADARKKFFDEVFAHLENQVRKSVSFVAE